MNEDDVGKACSITRKMSNEYKISITKPEVKRPLARSRWV